MLTMTRATIFAITLNAHDAHDTRAAALEWAATTLAPLPGRKMNNEYGIIILGSV